MTITVTSLIRGLNTIYWWYGNAANGKQVESNRTKNVYRKEEPRKRATEKKWSDFRSYVERFDIRARLKPKLCASINNIDKKKFGFPSYVFFGWKRKSGVHLVIMRWYRNRNSEIKTAFQKAIIDEEIFELFFCFTKKINIQIFTQNVDQQSKLMQFHFSCFIQFRDETDIDQHLLQLDHHIRRKETQIRMRRRCKNQIHWFFF